MLVSMHWSIHTWKIKLKSPSTVCSSLEPPSSVCFKRFPCMLQGLHQQFSHQILPLSTSHFCLNPRGLHHSSEGRVFLVWVGSEERESVSPLMTQTPTRKESQFRSDKNNSHSAFRCIQMADRCRSLTHMPCTPTHLSVRLSPESFSKD